MKQKHAKMWKKTELFKIKMTTVYTKAGTSVL